VSLTVIADGNAWPKPTIRPMTNKTPLIERTREAPGLTIRRHCIKGWRAIDRERDLDGQEAAAS
jgi:hypothetical protein